MGVISIDSVQGNMPFNITGLKIKQFIKKEEEL
jgi:hypothetical protein